MLRFTTGKSFAKSYLSLMKYSSRNLATLKKSSNSHSSNVLPFALTLAAAFSLAAYSNDKESIISLIEDTTPPKFYHSFASYCDEDKLYGIQTLKDQSLSNWSGTHHCSPDGVFEPKTETEVLRLLQYLHNNNIKARPIGSGLSPNGISFTKNHLIALNNLNHIEVDKEKQIVTVGSGITVSEILKELKKHNLTLENFSSIQEQQIGGWTQVSAHGTGARLPTVEEMILQLKLATPACGLLTLNNDINKEIFSHAKVGLGSFGVVTELTLKCIPSFNLVEHTYPSTLSKIEVDHKFKLDNYRHLRYMWLPYTEDVIVVSSNPEGSNLPDPSKQNVDNYNTSEESKIYRENPMKLMRELYMKVSKNRTEKDYMSLSFTQLRDRILSFGPLDLDLVKEINQAEAYYWRGQAGSRTEDSTDILGFDCGGAQWVFEVCFPIGTLESMENITNKNNKNSNVSSTQNIKYTNKDLEFVRKLLKIIEDNNIPAHCPIEQRWTASSTAAMSPAYSDNPDEVFCWVGIIMYLPPPPLPATREEQVNYTELEHQQRENITESFFRYKQLLRPLLEEYDAYCHWAKIELPKYDETSLNSTGTSNVSKSSDHNTLTDDLKNNLWKKISQKVLNTSSTSASSSLLSKEEQLQYLKTRIEKKYPVAAFNGYRSILDPKNILLSPLTENLLVDSNKK